jgi:hypothetical protein
MMIESPLRSHAIPRMRGPPGNSINLRVGLGAPGSTIQIDGVSVPWLTTASRLPSGAQASTPFSNPPPEVDSDGDVAPPGCPAESTNAKRFCVRPVVVAAMYAIKSRVGETALSPTASASGVGICRIWPFRTETAHRARRSPAGAAKVNLASVARPRKARGDFRIDHFPRRTTAVRRDVYSSNAGAGRHLETRQDVREGDCARDRNLTTALNEPDAHPQRSRRTVKPDARSANARAR